MVLQYWNSSVRPVNGAYFFLSGDMTLRAMGLDFKKNETDQTTTTITKQFAGSEIKNVSTRQQTAGVTALAIIQDGIYKIRINETGKYLAIAGQEDQNNGSRLIQWEMLPRNNHLFSVSRSGNGNYSIKALHSKKSLDVVDMRTEDGTQVQQWDDLNGTNQQWNFYNTPKGIKIVSAASGKRLQLSAGTINPANGVPLIISDAGSQSFSFLPAKANMFMEYISLKNVRFTVPHGGDLDMFGEIRVLLVDKNGNSYNRYYASGYKESLAGDNILFGKGESEPVNMDKRRVADFGGEVKFKISSEELPGAKIIIIYGINENDADAAALFQSYGAGKVYNDRPDLARSVDITPYRAGGSDDFYMIKQSFNDCLKSKIGRDGWSIQEFLVTDAPSNCLVHVNLQDEDGSENWLDVYFTVSRERKL
jgi:hypothetical protein